MKLITIPMSHYCEKARWGLLFAELGYEEQAHLQVFHYMAVRRYDANGMVPVLVDGDRAIADSTKILKYIDEQLPPHKKLYPAHALEDVEALEEYFDEDFGVETRRWVYYHWLKVPSREVLRIATQKTPAWQRLAAPVVFPVFRAYLTRYLKISEANVAAGRAVIDKGFEKAVRLLSDGRPFLCGDQLTAADIAFACMAAPVLLPPEYGIRLPSLDEAPPSARPDVLFYREHPAGQYALKLFQLRGHPTPVK